MGRAGAGTQDRREAARRVRGPRFGGRTRLPSSLPKQRLLHSCYEFLTKQAPLIV